MRWVASAWELAAALVLGLFLSSGAAAAPPTPASAPLAHLHHTAWTAKDGVPGLVMALAQTSDGYLWLGTVNGLMRFDGVRFESFESIAGEPLPSKAIHALQAAPDNGLWVGYIEGGVSLVRQGRVLRSDRSPALFRGTTRRFGLAKDGTLLTVTGRSLLKRVGETWTEIGAEADYPGQGKIASMDLLVDHDDHVWVSTNQGLYVKRAGQDRFTKMPIAGLNFAALAVAPDGHVWASDMTQGRGVIRLPRPGVASDPMDDWRPAPESFFAPLFDRQGQLWYGAEDGLSRENPAGRGVLSRVEHLSPEQGGLSGDRVLRALQDREGNVWVGTNGGLDRFRPTPLARLDFPKRPSGVSMTVGPGGEMWFAARDQGVFRFDGMLHKMPTGELGAPGVMTVGRQGQAWLGYRSGLWRLAGGRLERLLPPDVKDWNFSITNLYEDHAGVVWVSANGLGFFRYDHGRWERFSSRPGVPREPPLSIGSDASGRVWVGYQEGRLLRLENDQLKLYGPGDGIRVGSVKAVSTRGPRVWIGGDHGVQSMDRPGLPMLQAQEPGALEGITGIIETAAGDLWLNGATGITHVEAAQVQRALAEPAYRVRSRRYNTLDGLPGWSEQVWPLRTALEAPDGRLWFSLSNGVVSLDPRTLGRNAVAPTVEVQRVVADADHHPHLGTGPVVLPAGARDLQVDYAATSLAMPERVHFRYRLAGLDAGWQDAGTRRRAFYTNLGPGRYRFEVLASNEDGVWSPVPASLAIEIPPTLTQTLWFRIVLALLALLALALLIMLRSRRLAARARERLHVRLQERERIARDLHDTLLQGFYGLVLRLQAVSLDVPVRTPQHTREELERVLVVADQLLTEGRDRVADLRLAPSTAFVEDAIAPLGQDLSRYQGADFHLSVQGRPRLLQPILREEFCLIAREALFNAFQHAAASRIDVEVRYGDESFAIVVRDDGKGVPPEVMAQGAKPGHWGLSGMRERAQLAGGRLTLGSGQAGGTTITLTVPAQKAYADPPATS